MWIEIQFLFHFRHILRKVTPLAGVWIEIVWGNPAPGAYVVTPLAGVWIEIAKIYDRDFSDAVTPLAGVWIEIKPPVLFIVSSLSLPLRECGLKCQNRINNRAKH